MTDCAILTLHPTQRVLVSYTQRVDHACQNTGWGQSWHHLQEFNPRQLVL